MDCNASTTKILKNKKQLDGWVLHKAAYLLIGFKEEIKIKI